MSELKIHAPESKFKLHVQGINLQFTFDYSVWSEPELLLDSGSGRLDMAGCNIDLVLALTQKDGALQVDFTDVKILLLDYTVKLDGSSDLSQAVEIILKNFKKFIQKEITNVLAWRLTKSLESSLN